MTLDEAREDFLHYCEAEAEEEFKHGKMPSDWSRQQSTWLAEAFCDDYLSEDEEADELVKQLSDLAMDEVPKFIRAEMDREYHDTNTWPGGW